MYLAFAGSVNEWLNIIGVFVIITLLLSNAMGLAQSSAKRMLAYSSVSHAGYLALIFFGANSLSLFIFSTQIKVKNTPIVDNE